MAWRTLIFLVLGFAGGVWSERTADPFAANLIRALTFFAWLVWFWLRLVRVPWEIDDLETYRQAGAENIVVESIGDKHAWVHFDGPGRRLQRRIKMTREQRKSLTVGYDPENSVTFKSKRDKRA